MVVMKIRDWLEFRGANLLKREVLYNGIKAPQIYLDKYARNEKIFYSVKLRGYVNNNFKLNERNIISAKDVASSYLSFLNSFDPLDAEYVLGKLVDVFSSVVTYGKNVKIFRNDILIFDHHGMAVFELCLFMDDEICRFSFSFNGDWEVPSRIVISLDEGRAILNKIASI